MNAIETTGIADDLGSEQSEGSGASGLRSKASVNRLCVPDPSRADRPLRA
jgi:hypothetical protein